MLNFVSFLKIFLKLRSYSVDFFEANKRHPECFLWTTAQEFCSDLMSICIYFNMLMLS